MTTQKIEQIILPALRGSMGNWVYYSCLMSLGELARRVRYADEVHGNKPLSEMIQRALEDRRSVEIARYLREQPERFFNSLVVATYGGAPNWHPLTDVSGDENEDALKGLTNDLIHSVGFLTLNGDEKLFAVDGQHRLAGIKRSVGDGEDEDVVSVIFVSHERTPNGLQRTRRLFTTLNKTARPVSKGNIIALDEDDVMAICVRRLIEETRFFSGSRVATVASNNIPPSNVECLTTIGNLYDTLGVLFSRASTEMKKPAAQLKRIRPDDETLEKYFDLYLEFFREGESHIDEWAEFFGADDAKPVVAKYRGRHGGSALFRPVGIDVFTRVVADLTEKMSLSKAVELASALPRTLSEPPHLGLMWDARTARITNANKRLLREVLLYMLNSAEKSDTDLTEEYRQKQGMTKPNCPSR